MSQNRNSFSPAPVSDHKTVGALKRQILIGHRTQFVRLVLGLLVLGAVAGSEAVQGAENMETNNMQTETADPYLWLEDIHGAKAMEWVKAQNAKSAAVLQADPDYQTDYDAILKVMDATDRIPYRPSRPQ